MNEARDEQPVPSQKGEVSESDAPQMMQLATETGNPDREPFAGAEKLSLEIDRFSGLSSKMLEVLADLSRDIHRSAEEAHAVRAAVDLKNREIEALRESEKSVRALEQQMEDLRKQKENLERLVADQRCAWEAERVRRTREENEYDENRKILREREEEAYKKAWATEQLKARQMLDEELSVTRQRGMEAHEAAERHFLERELILKKKEQEWSQLIQELDHFLSMLAKRTHPRSAVPALLLKDDPEGSGSPASSMLSTRNLREDENSSEIETQSCSDPKPDEILMWENTWDEIALALEEKQLVIGKDLTKEPKNSPPSLKDLHILQGRRIEDKNPESSTKREGNPLKFSPRNANNNKAED
jgi:hypothetical protein